MDESRYRWCILAFTVVLQATTLGTILYSFTLYAPEWLDAFGASRAEVMLAISAMQLSFGLLSPLVGGAMDRYRVRNIVLFGCVCYALGWWLVARATQLWHLLAIYALVFPFAMTTMGTLASQTLVTRWFTRQRGLAVGLSAMGTNVGGVVVPLLVAASLAAGLWRDVAVWLLVGGVALVVPLTLLILSRPSPRQDTHEIQTALTFGDVIRSRTFRIAASAFLPLNLTFGATQFNMGVFAHDLGFAEQAGFIVALGSVSMIAGKLFFGALGDWLDHRALHGLAVASMVTAMLLLQNEPGWWRLLAAVVCVGLAGGSLLPMMGLVISSRFPSSGFGRGMGALMLTLTLASLGPIIAGWIYDAYGSYDTAFLLFIGLMLPGAVAMRWLPPPLER